MANARRKKVRLVPDTGGLILVVAVASYPIFAGDPSSKAVIGIAVLYAVTAATTNFGSAQRPGRK